MKFSKFRRSIVGIKILVEVSHHSHFFFSTTLWHTVRKYALQITREYSGMAIFPSQTYIKMITPYSGTWDTSLEIGKVRFEMQKNDFLTW